MFDEYLQDAHALYAMAREARQAKDERTARRYYRASAFYASGAMESFLNYVAESFAHAGNLDPFEIAFLNDKTLVYSPKDSSVSEKVEFHKLDEKIKVIMRRFAPDYTFNTPEWSYLMQFKDFRDSLVHPRAAEDETTLADYENQLKRGLAGVVQMMNILSQGVFHRPLRRQLLDLIPE